MKNSVVSGMGKGYYSENRKVDIILTPVFPASTKAGFSFERFFALDFDDFTDLREGDVCVFMQPTRNGRCYVIELSLWANQDQAQNYHDLLTAGMSNMSRERVLE